MVFKQPNNFVPTKMSPSPPLISGLGPPVWFPLWARPLAKLCNLPRVPFSSHCPHLPTLSQL